MKTVVKAVISLSGLTPAQFDDVTNTVRVALIAAIKIRVAEFMGCAADPNTDCSGDNVELVIDAVTALETSSGPSKRRLSGSSIAVSFTVKALLPMTSASTTPDAMVADLTAYLYDASATGLAASLPADSSGQPVSVVVVSVPSAATATTAPDSPASTNAVLYIALGVGGAAAFVGLVAIIVVVAVVFAIGIARKGKGVDVADIESVGGQGLGGQGLGKGVAVGKGRVITAIETISTDVEMTSMESNPIHEKAKNLKKLREARIEKHKARRASEAESEAAWAVGTSAAAEGGAEAPDGSDDSSHY